MTADLSLTLTRRIAAPPARVYAAWLDPETLGRFMFPAARVDLPRITTDPRPGGAFEIVMRQDGRDLPHHGVYRALEPHARIVFTWNSPHASEDSLVTLTFAPDGDGTLVTLLHERFLTGEMRDNHKAGWTRILGALDDLLEREDAA